jgi:hypothetical protein
VGGYRIHQEERNVLDTDPGEAKLLIGLIETLIEDWYVSREDRRKRLQEIRQITGESVAEKESDD